MWGRRVRWCPPVNRFFTASDGVVPGERTTSRDRADLVTAGGQPAAVSDLRRRPRRHRKESVLNACTHGAGLRVTPHAVPFFFFRSACSTRLGQVVEEGAVAFPVGPERCTPPMVKVPPGANCLELENRVIGPGVVGGESCPQPWCLAGWGASGGANRALKAGRDRRKPPPRPNRGERRTLRPASAGSWLALSRRLPGAPDSRGDRKNRLKGGCGQDCQNRIARPTVCSQDY